MTPDTETQVLTNLELAANLAVAALIAQAPLLPSTPADPWTLVVTGLTQAGSLGLVVIALLWFLRERDRTVREDASKRDDAFIGELRQQRETLAKELAASRELTMRLMEAERSERQTTLSMVRDDLRRFESELVSRLDRTLEAIQDAVAQEGRS